MSNLMKSLRHARAAALIALGAAFAAVAQAQDAAESLDRIRSVAEAAVRKNLPASAEVSADSLDSRLRLAACAGKLQAEAGAMRGSSNNVTVRLEGPTAWTLCVTVRVRRPDRSAPWWG